MIGWHYTSEDCWVSIQRDGLVPYNLSHPSLIGQPCPRKGIWLYTERQQGLSHLGCLLWQLHHRRTTRLVLLKVQYSVSDTLFESSDWRHFGTKSLALRHDLTVEGMAFHLKAPATIIWQPVPSRRVSLVASYDLVELVDPKTKEIKLVA